LLSYCGLTRVADPDDEPAPAPAPPVAAAAAAAAPSAPPLSAAQTAESAAAAAEEAEEREAAAAAAALEAEFAETTVLAASVDWNEEFQQLLETPVQTPAEQLTRAVAIDRYAQACLDVCRLTPDRRLARKFSVAASAIGRTIIQELAIPAESRSIRPINIGGVAGGTCSFRSWSPSSLTPMLSRREIHPSGNLLQVRGGYSQAVWWCVNLIPLAHRF
jgi:hypothetical protein